MKKLPVLLAAALLLIPSILRAQEIRSIDTHLYIDGQGDALVRQFWDVTAASGTEWYIPIGNLGEMQIRGLKVYEDGVEFQDEGRTWNTDRGLIQKAGRSGIVEKKDGVEICWGIGSLGPHKWESQYVALGLVQSLQDYDAFNYMLVNPGLVAPPQKVTVTVHKLDGGPFEADSTRFWFFGCGGPMELKEDGTIYFEAENLRRNDSVILMMCFEKGVFSPTISRDIPFEKMQKKAFKGSSYQEKKGLAKLFSGISMDEFIDIFFELLIFLVAIGSGLVFVVLWIKDLILKATGRSWSAKTFGATSVSGWEREAPFKGSIPAAAYLLQEGTRLSYKPKHPERAIGAYFLKWVQDGIAKPLAAPDGHYDLILPDVQPDFGDDCEASLFRKAFEASGENHILEKGEFDSWAEKHYKSLTGWPQSVINLGKSQVSAYGGNAVSEAAKLLKFKNFLNDFTLSKVREVPEVGLWGQYLVFAQLFGIADKVAKGFAKMYPTQFEEYTQRFGMDVVTMNTFMNSWSGTARHAYNAAYSKQVSAEAAARSKAAGGHGGFSSFGGGGGFSGGGFGGGTR